MTSLWVQEDVPELAKCSQEQKKISGGRASLIEQENALKISSSILRGHGPSAKQAKNLAQPV